jgi:hypothetical protein
MSERERVAFIEGQRVMRTRLLGLIELMPKYEGIGSLQREHVLVFQDVRDLILTTPIIVDLPPTDKMSVGGL